MGCENAKEAQDNDIYAIEEGEEEIHYSFPVELNKALKRKFGKQSNLPIKYYEITEEEFLSVLNRNEAAEKIIEKYGSKIKEIEYESDVKYRNINAIKVMDPEGGVQYYKGGYNNEGQCHGEGIWIKDNNIYIGNFRNDNFHGIGLFITAEGDYYFGEWENSQCNGYGSLMMDQKLEYQGDFRNSRKEGYGEEKYPDGDIYKGLFYQGEKNGKGQYIFADGSRYDGNFKKSKYNGYGQLSLPGGNTIRGDFKDGKLNGKGDFMWNDGSKFVGQFINDEKNGEGLYVWKNGISFKGSWNGNDPYGKGLLNDPSKSIQKTINF